MFACREHWYDLPKKLRDAIWREYRDGQEVDKRPSARYLAVQTVARARLAFKPNDEAAALLCAELLLEANVHRTHAIRADMGDPFSGIGETGLVAMPLVDRPS